MDKGQKAKVMLKQSNWTDLQKIIKLIITKLVGIVDKTKQIVIKIFVLLVASHFPDV